MGLPVMIDRLAHTDQTLRDLQLAKWRGTWALPAETQPVSSPATTVSPAGVTAASAMVASAVPLPFSAAAPSASTGGAYAISATLASRAYSEDWN